MELIGKVGDKEIYLIYSKNCVYVTDRILNLDKAFDEGYGWFITEKAAIEFCINYFKNLELI